MGLTPWRSREARGEFDGKDSVSGEGREVVASVYRCYTSPRQPMCSTKLVLSLAPRTPKSHLDKANVGRLLPEALAADVEAVLADETGAMGANAAVVPKYQGQSPLLSPPSKKARAKDNHVPGPRPLAVLPRPRVPDGLVRHFVDLVSRIELDDMFDPLSGWFKVSIDPRSFQTPNENWWCGVEIRWGWLEHVNRTFPPPTLGLG